MMIMKSCSERRARPRIGNGVAIATAMGMTLLLAGLPPVQVLAAANSVEQGVTPLDDLDLSKPQHGESVVPTDKREKWSPFFSDSEISAQLRTYYFDRDKFDDTESKAWTIGGSVSLVSGYLADFFKAGLVGYTSQPLDAPEDTDGTLLLKPGQEGYSVVGQIYGEIKIVDKVFAAAGRRAYNTPYVNKNDDRMTPNTFEGGAFYGTLGGEDGIPLWRYGVGYLTKIKERNSDEFVWMSVAAGAAVNRGVFIAALTYKQDDLFIGAANYYSEDIINIIYAKTDYTLSLSNGSPLTLSAQYSDQRSTGDDLLTGSAFSTSQWGVKADLGLGPALLTAAYTDTADGDTMRSPWSGYPGFTNVQVDHFFRAGESALMLRASYDFSDLGAKGLSAYALWVNGSGVAPPLYNEDEIDLNLQWTPDKSSALRGLSFRARYANVQQSGGGDPDLNDFRIIVNYDFPRS